MYMTAADNACQLASYDSAARVTKVLAGNLLFAVSTSTTCARLLIGICLRRPIHPTNLRLASRIFASVSFHVSPSEMQPGKAGTSAAKAAFFRWVNKNFQLHRFPQSLYFNARFDWRPITKQMLLTANQQPAANRHRRRDDSLTHVVLRQAA